MEITLDLFSQESRYLLGVALNHLRNYADAEDAVQDAWVRVLECGYQLRDQAKVKPWLIRIVCRRCIDLLRRRVVMVPIEYARHIQQPEHWEPDFGRLDLLAELSECDRGLLEERYLKGISSKDLAAARGVSVGAIDERIYRIKRKLRRRNV